MTTRASTDGRSAITASRSAKVTENNTNIKRSSNCNSSDNDSNEKNEKSNNETEFTA